MFFLFYNVAYARYSRRLLYCRQLRKFIELYNFSSYLIDKGVKVIKARAEGRFGYGNIPKAPPDVAYLILRDCDRGQPIINGDTIEVNGKSYSLNP